MGRKYSDIDRAEELLAAYNAKKLYLAKSKIEKAAAYAATVKDSEGKRLRVGSQDGYVNVFGSANSWVKSKLLSANDPKGDPANGETDAALITLVTNAVVGTTDKYAVTTLPTGASDTIIDIPKTQGLLAKVALTRRSGDTKSRKSRVTGRPYKAKTSNTASCVFGSLVNGTATTGSYTSAVSVLTTALVPKGSEGLSISFRPQGNINVS